MNDKISILEAQGDKILMDKFIEQNQALVKSVIKQYFAYVLNTDSYKDYYQCGCIGLIKAARQYNPEFKTAFSTYAVPAIIGAIKMHQRDFENNTLKIPRKLKYLYYSFCTLRGQGMTNEEICIKLNVTQKKLNSAINAMQIVSLNEKVCSNGKEITFEELLPCESNVEEETIAKIESIELDELYKKHLSDDYYVYRLRAEGKSERIIAEMIGVSQVHVNRIIRQIIEKCKIINSAYENGQKISIEPRKYKKIRRQIPMETNTETMNIKQNEERYISTSKRDIAGFIRELQEIEKIVG